VLQVAPSAYRRYAARCRQPELRSQRAQKDEQLRPQIYRVWEQNFRVYGARKVWKQMNRESIRVARCTVERLMGDLGIEWAFPVPPDRSDGMIMPGERNDGTQQKTFHGRV